MATWAKRECLEEVAYVAPAAERDDVMITTVWTIISTSVTWYMSVSHRRTTGRPADHPLSADQTAEKTRHLPMNDRLRRQLARRASSARASVCDTRARHLCSPTVSSVSSSELESLVSNHVSHNNRPVASQTRKTPISR